MCVVAEMKDMQALFLLKNDLAIATFNCTIDSNRVPGMTSRLMKSNDSSCPGMAIDLFS